MSKSRGEKTKDEAVIEKTYASVSSRTPIDVFLSSDERYDVWVVKSAERPELLLPTSSSEVAAYRIYSGDSGDVGSTCCTARSLIDDEFKDENKGCAETAAEPLPLTDGCDLESWRRHNIVRTTCHMLAVMNVGTGCCMLRRERQIALVGSRSLREWKALREKLYVLPSVDLMVATIDSDTVKSLPLHPWFERKNVPAVLLGCTTDWNAMKTCRFENLVNRFGYLPWRFSDTHGETMKLRTYQKYLSTAEGQLDDAPLAVYDSQFHLDERAEILREYSVPACFAGDLFDLLDDDARPPYRWILIGPPRSGTGLHIDPTGTHAWVTLVQGLKRWVLFPPTSCPDWIGLSSKHQIPSSIWFRDHYDRVMAGDSCRGAIHILQRPGETVYVPAGWPHLVLNLDLSVAITHNFASEHPSMLRLWDAVRRETNISEPFLDQLRQHRPDLHAQLLDSTDCEQTA
jgi:histone arginine demethylase JMJD6